MQKTLIHLDSLNATQRGNVFDFYDCSISLGNTYKNVSKIVLKSMELPLGINNIRSPFNELKIKIGNTIHTVIIPTSNYTSIDTLIFNTNLACENILGSLVCVFFRVGDYVSVSSIRTTNDWSILNTSCSNLIFGIRSTDVPQILVAGNTYTRLNTQFRYCLNLDNYINLYCQEIGVTSNNSLSSFKILLPINNGDILYLNENLFFSNQIDVNIFSLSSLSFLFSDRFNTPLKGDFSWSATFELTCDL